MFTVTITELGRDKVTVNREFENEPAPEEIESLFRPHLRSSDPFFEIAENGTGYIFAGFHRVGLLKIEPPPAWAQ